jgi:hypothetical protein
MSYDETIFERDTLYARVWSEPLRTVAASYGLSDVGLRKICKRLGIPVPPLGYRCLVRNSKHLARSAEIFVQGLRLERPCALPEGTITESPHLPAVGVTARN